MKEIKYFLTISILFFVVSCEKREETSESNTVINEYAELDLITDGLEFAEGPAYYSSCLFFSDIQATKIYKWSEIDGLSIFTDNSGGANGLYFDLLGNLYVCEGEAQQVSVYDTEGEKEILASEFEQKFFNEPNDLWISPNGNIYFTDPVYTNSLSQDGEYVYVIISSTGEILRLENDLVRPNGIVGNAEGTALYITDHGGGKIYRYHIESDGSLSGKTLFVSVGADGLTMDKEGNIYLTSDDILVYNSQGELIETIAVPGTLTNLCFGGAEGKTLFITTHNAVYSLEMKVQGSLF